MVTIYLLDGESLKFREAKNIEIMSTDGVSFLGFVAHGKRYVFTTRGCAGWSVEE
jgi:hypothetical protein